MKMMRRIGMLDTMNSSIRCLAILTMFGLLAACGTMRSAVVLEPAGSAGHGSHDRGSGTPAGEHRGSGYVVVRGDTLYSIAFRNGVDFRDLAQWNGIVEPYTIWPGQRLQLAASRGTRARPVAAAAPPPPRAAPVVAAVKPVPVTAPVEHRVPATSSGTDTGRAVAPGAAVSASVTAQVPASTFAQAGSGVARSVSGVIWRWPVDGSLIKRFQSGDAIPGIEITGKAGDPVRAAADGVVVYSGNGLVGYGELVIIKHSDSFLSAYGHNRKRLVKEGDKVSVGQPIAEMGSTGTNRDELEFQIRKDGNPVDPLVYLPAR